MTEKLVQSLIALYRQVIVECERHLEILNAFPDIREDEGLEEKLRYFSGSRDDSFNCLKAHADKISQLQKEICDSLKIPAFQTELLRPFLNDSLYRDLGEAMGSLKNRLVEIQEIEHRHISKLQEKIEVVKTELSGIRESNKLKNIYQNSTYKEPRFIDKQK